MKKLFCLFVLCSAGAALVGCGDDDRGGPEDAGCAGRICLDAGPMVDTGPGVDTGRPDTGMVPGGCQVGTGCTPDRGCRSGSCQAEIAYEIGGTGDEILDHPMGLTGVPAAYFEGGYCTPSPIAMPMTGCDPNDDMACGDPDCSRCIDLGGVVMCMRSCTPTATDNSECPQDTQSCLFGEGFCFDGCASDDTCRIYRADTNMDGDIQGPEPMMTAVDRLHYDTMSMATCNPATRRCDQPSGGGAAGDACTRTSQCEANGLCIAGWPGGGYCTRLGCDTPGVTCEGDGKCQSRRVGVGICGQPCTVAEEAMDPMLVTGTMGHGTDCRPGYACSWDGMNGEGTVNGICLPGTYNDRTMNNVGAPCDANADVPDCYSPFGQGVCLGGDGTVWGPDNYCSILDCAAPGMPADVCGPAAQCVVFFSTDGVSQDLGACFENCTTADTCNTGDACFPAGMLVMGATGNICFPICNADTQCRTGQRCNIPAGAMTGECM